VTAALLPASGPANGGADHGVRHVAIIMDGNGRWAKKRHLPRVLGHQRGVEAVRRLIRGVRGMGLEAVTLYAFSSENWRRPEQEVRSDGAAQALHHQRSG
jgi:undecaprenyl diphosphate synthase